MNYEELRQISLIQLEIMDEIHKICEEENIRYYMDGGTLLGAVRHKGFIPWDLDIDIAMPRDDYEKFKNVCSIRLKAPYQYLDHSNCRVFFRPHALVARMDTRIYSKYDITNPKLLDLGVYVDIFPLDNVPDEPALQKKQAKRLRYISQFKKIRIPYSYSSKKWKRYAHYLVSASLSWISVRAINCIEQKQMVMYRHQETSSICNMASRYAYSKHIMEWEIYGEPVKLQFEGREYYGPAEYREYLTRIYGDYMKFPPQEEIDANLEAFAAMEFL